MSVPNDAELPDLPSLFREDELLQAAKEITNIPSSGYRVTLDQFRSEDIETLGLGASLIVNAQVHGYHWGGGMGDGSASDMRGQEFWRSFKAEFRDFLCTKNKKYEDLRKRLAAGGRQTQLALVSMVSAGLSAHVGIAAGLITPICALCLLAVLKMGNEAFCRGGRLLAKPE